MADLSDVEAAIATLLGAAIYPNGTTQPSAAGGGTVRIYRGWPNAAELDSDLSAGICHLTVFPMQGMTENTSRYETIWSPNIQPTPTLTITLTDTVATIGGTGGAGQVAGLASYGFGYAYRLGAGDTPATVAAALAAEMPFATASGSTVTLSYGHFQFGQVVADAMASAEVARTRQGFQVSCWCPDPLSRDALGKLMRTTMASLQDANGNFTDRITFADGSVGYSVFQREYVFDQSENANLYRRDAIYRVEYPTIVTQTFPAMLFGSIDVETTQGAVTSFGLIPPPSVGILTDGSGNILTSETGFSFGS
jgi:hypothetical protein